MQDGAGIPDGFARLWMPHRMAYIKGENKPAGQEGDGCPFCRIPSLSDEDGLIVARGSWSTASSTCTPTTRGT